MSRRFGRITSPVSVNGSSACFGGFGMFTPLHLDCRHHPVSSRLHTHGIAKIPGY
ncbi:hypothetical protein P154DRAFT_232152 [Amniculicola lignicola CBS 123094]|uniref:Uncharacterized protein n=1 Tax=Amniculicola lignicola CBS 123094 TaxID=1392246 RepID=A0A6A5WJD6_9PLEO|nr:hypothetical protein P154DRAFT_232152 [Amniculicola lignicola CBS 123094]